MLPDDPPVHIHHWYHHSKFTPRKPSQRHLLCLFCPIIPSHLWGLYRESFLLLHGEGFSLPLLSLGCGSQNEWIPRCSFPADQEHLALQKRKVTCTMQYISCSTWFTAWPSSSLVPRYPKDISQKEQLHRVAADAEARSSGAPCSRSSTRCQPRSSLGAAASPGPALLPAQAVDQNSLEGAVESSDQGKIKHELPQKEGCLWVYSCFTLLLARCFIRASALPHWGGGCCSGKESLDLFSSAVSSQCKLEQRQVLPAERCEPNRQMNLLALEKSRTL